MVELSPFLYKLNKLSQDSFPTCASIEVTNRCNAHCQYCYITDRIYSPELTTLKIHSIIDKLDKAGILYLNITGGEPFLRKDINEILEHCFSCSFFYCSIFSNGTVVNNDHIDLLKKYHTLIRPFRMTVFSHHEKVHDDYMNIPGSFKSILETGKKLLDAGVDVQLSLSIMTFNLDEIEKSVAFFIERGFTIGYNTTKLITNDNNNPQINYMISEEFYRKLLHKRSNEQIKNLLNNGAIDPNMRDQLCRGIREMIMIDIHGDIHPCTAFRNFTIGSILQDAPLNEILNKNKEYKDLKCITMKDLACKDCEFSQFCFPCLAYKHSIDGSFEGFFPQNCNYAKAVFVEGKERGLL